MQNLPRVWLIIGDKAGDNAQVQAVAEALNWPIEVKHLVFQTPYQQGKPKFKPSLEHLDCALSDPLTPPWPDLILTIGRRPAMAALWIKQQSGGRTKVVLLGRPKGYFSQFDLVVTSAQYLVTHRPNVVKLTLPLLKVNEKALAEAVSVWRDRLAHLPRPLIAVLVGGETKPYRFDVKVARKLLEEVQAVCGQGTLYLSTSRRTPGEVVETLQALKPNNALLYRYGLDKPEDNPYLALLGLADGCIVTADSISMMVEVLRLRKPLAIFSLPVRGKMRLEFKRFFLSLLGGRDFSAFHRLLFERGWAVPLGQGQFPYLPPRLELSEELPDVVRRIKALVS